jgi:CRP-like cAMP-binding protein
MGWEACMRTICRACPLRSLSAFTKLPDDKLDFIQSIRSSQTHYDAGSWIIHAGQPAELYTLFSGWAFRFKTLPDGRRQILNFMLPGDLMGLQASLFSDALYDVVALTAVELCIFPRSKIWLLYERMPELAFDMTWLGAREESQVDDNLTSVGARSATERVAALIIGLYRRADLLGMARDKTLLFPLSQQHIADALGLSLVHTNKTINRLRRMGVFDLSHGLLTLQNLGALERIAQAFEIEIAPRPLI